MTTKLAYINLGRLMAAWIGVSGLMASEYRGVVKSGSLPVPGVTVTATQGDKKLSPRPMSRASFGSPSWPTAPGRLKSRCLGLRKSPGKSEWRPAPPLRNGD